MKILCCCGSGNAPKGLQIDKPIMLVSENGDGITQLIMKLNSKYFIVHVFKYQGARFILRTLYQILIDASKRKGPTLSIEKFK